MFKLWNFLNFVVVIILFSHLPVFYSNTVTTLKFSEEIENPVRSDCEDEFPQEFCDLLQEGTDSDNCEESPYKDGCKRTCGLCSRHVDKNPEEVEDEIVLTSTTLTPDLEKGCQDKIPNCDEYVTLCCQMKEAMNQSCEKTCRFCTETPSQGAGGVPVPTGSSNQDPCGSTNPPSVTVDAPAGPGPQTTSTTLAPVTVPPGAGEGVPTKPVGR